MDALTIDQRRHAREPVGEAIERAAGGHEERARRIEAQKPHARHTANTDVGADVELRDRTESQPPRPGRRPRPDHAKRDDRRPRLPFVKIRLDPGR